MKKLLFFLIVFASCSSPEETGIALLNVGISSSEEILKTSDVFSLCSLVTIETPDDEHLIGSPSCLVERRGFYYISDRVRVLKVNADGEIVGLISKRGQGPEEYMHVTDIEIDDDDHLWVLCRGNKTLYCYSWDGELLKKIVSDAWLMHIKYVGNNRMLCYIGNEKDENNDHQLRTIDLVTGDVLGRELPIDEKKAEYLHILTRNHFYENDRLVYFYQGYNDTIYAFDENFELVPHLFVDFGGNNIPSSVFERSYEDVRDFSQHIDKDIYAYGTNIFLKQGEKDLLCFMYKNDYHWWFSKGDEQKHGALFIDDTLLDGYRFRMGDDPFFVQKDGVLIIALSPFMIIETMKESMDAATLEHLRTILNYVGDDQNPVLLRMQL